MKLKGAGGITGALWIAAAAAADRIYYPGAGSSTLTVLIPHSLFKEGGYAHLDALFGMHPVNGSIAQPVYYAGSEFCDESKGVWQPPFILMVDRGSCTFVQKVRNAQRAGAAAVIIANNACLCSDVDCRNGQTGSDDSCDIAEPIMADDGSGTDITIPSVLMKKNDANLIKAKLKNKDLVKVKITWTPPILDDRVEYDLWTTPFDTISPDFYKNWKLLAKAFNRRAYFTPHMYIHNGIKMGCQVDGKNACPHLCTNNGRYCATNAVDALQNGISGVDVIQESLRRLCIWEQYGVNSTLGKFKGVGPQWWRYVEQFNVRCKYTGYFSDYACVKDAYKHASVDAEKVNQCMTSSGGLDDDTDNVKLSAEIAAQEQRRVAYIPAVFVNNAALTTSLTPTNVFSAVCAGFARGTKPRVCRKCATSTDAPACVKRLKP